MVLKPWKGSSLVMGKALPLEMQERQGWGGSCLPPCAQNDSCKKPCPHLTLDS